MTAQPSFQDWLAISNLKAAYCRLLDTKDWAGWTELFTEDYHLDVTASGGGEFHGRDAALASVIESIGEARTAHQVHSPEMAIDGDVATVVWAMQDRVVWEGGRGLVGYGHYHDRYVRTDKGWRIAAVRLTRLQMDFDAE